MSSNPSAETRRHHLTREEEADRSLNHTEFGPGAKLWTVVFFLFTIFIVPIAQHIVEIRANIAAKKENVLPEIYSIGKLMPTSEQLGKAHGFWDYWALIPTTEQITAFEDDLKSNSVLTKSLLSPAQAIMTGTFGVGNEKAYVGRDGWLFYRPDVDYLTSDGFLHPEVLRLRSHAAGVQPDPVKAIVNTRDQLAAQGITLIVMPVPTKPMIHPEMLIGDSAASLTLQNPSYGQFLARMKDNQIPVFDPTNILLSQKSKASQYLKTDTHWTPEAMDLVAKELADTLKASVAGGYDVSKLPHEEAASITAYGDIFQMLKLPADQHLFSKETVSVGRVSGFGDEQYRSGPILLLGDSFSNIYSLEGMGWGTSAGFAERLTFHLGVPVDKIVINAGGAFSSRQDLQARLKRGEDRLAGKKVVIWEFCMRDLAQGDWKMLDLPKPSGRSDVGTPQNIQGMTITGRIAERADPPKPGSVPYKDCVIALHIADAKNADGTALGKDLLVYVWGMKDNQLVDSDFALGKTVTIGLTPWSKVEGQYGGYNRMEIDNPDSFDWDVYWGEKK